jgi:hypothetical protein
MQWHEFGVVPGGDRACVLHSPLDVARAGEEAQHLSTRLGHHPAQRVGQAASRGMLDAKRVSGARHAHDRTIHPFGDDPHAGVRREAALEAYVPPHLAPRRPSLVGRDAAGHGTGGHAARLQHDHATRVGHGRRHAGRLAGPRGGHHGRTALGERGADGGEVPVDGKGVAHRRRNRRGRLHR